MKFRNINILLIALLMISCSENHEQDFGYVNNAQLYSNFQLTKDLSKDYDKVFESRKTVLDSMEIKLAGLSKALELGKDKEEVRQYARLEEEYVVKKRQLEEENQLLNQKYQNQILTQLNDYLKDFGKSKNLKILFGTTGNGEIMYADSTIDYTKEAVEFINKKYSGGK